MAASTGPILATTGLVVVNDVVFNEHDWDWRVPIAGLGASVVFALIERASERFAVGVAYIALLTVVLARTRPGKPSIAENALRWWNSW